MQPTHDSDEAPPTKPLPPGTAARDGGAEGEGFGPYPAQILATEHWSLLGTRSLIWNEALTRATVFLTVLSATIYSLAWLWIHFVVNTPTIVATVDAAVAAAVTVLLLQVAEASTPVLASGGGFVFLVIWVTLYLLQLRVLGRLIDQAPRFPTPSEGA